MRYQSARARIRLESLAFQLFRMIAFIFFVEQKLAQALTEFFHTEISFNDTAVTNRNLAGFLRDNEHDGVRLLAQA